MARRVIYCTPDCIYSFGRILATFSPDTSSPPLNMKDTVFIVIITPETQALWNTVD